MPKKGTPELYVLRRAKTIAHSPLERCRSI